jgi:competence protein ComEA
MKRYSALCALLLGLPGIAFGAGPVNINTASERELADSLDGIGPSRARSIVTWRDIHGPYESVDDLAEVPGIGEKFVELNRSLLTVGDPGPGKVAKEAREALKEAVLEANKGSPKP